MKPYSRTSHWKSLLLFALLTCLFIAPAQAQDANALVTAARPWLNAVGYLMIAGAAVCFIFTAYEAFQREWSKALVGLLVCLVLGFAPSVLKWVSAQWGVNSAQGSSSTGTLFM